MRVRALLRVRTLWAIAAFSALQCPIVLAQQPPPPTQVLSPQQLDDLVAPIALYPDSLLSQILVASTYPLELVEAGQWLQQNGNLQGKQREDAARMQNWDPSVQALVIFPDVIGRLTQDIRWITDLGNAFLAQQSDLMTAVQRMRARAEANGKLQSGQQQTVTQQTQNGQTAIDIQPTNPQDVYVPDYNPDYIWGPPDYGFYPPLLYPGIDVGFGFFPGISVGLFFGDCCGWGGWGWGPNWFGGNVFVNNHFFHRYGFRDFDARRFHATEPWTHDPGHRLGVPYPNQGLREQFRGASGPGGADIRGSGFNQRAQINSNTRSDTGATGRFGTPQFEQRNFGGSHSVFGGAQRGGSARFESDHGFHSMGGFGGAGTGGFAGGGFHGGSPVGGGPRGGGGRR